MSDHDEEMEMAQQNFESAVRLDKALGDRYSAYRWVAYRIAELEAENRRLKKELERLQRAAQVVVDEHEPKHGGSVEYQLMLALQPPSGEEQR